MTEHKLFIHNTLTRKKEEFKPLHPGRVGMYVCGPTVYGDPHLGHARPAITFDLLFRLLKNEGYKVRYVRNITDVGHLEHDADEGEDKIAKKAKLEQLEPMEVAQHYSNRFHKAMDDLNVLPPSIEPQASGHIIEQEALVQKILDNGYAYERNGSIYFDVEKYNSKYHYGILSGRNLEDTIDASRTLDGVDEKRNQVDFALWKKARPEHIALAISLGRRLSGLALRMYGYGTQVLGRSFRHPRRRYGPRLPTSRMRNRASRGGRRGTNGALLDAQQHDHDQRPEDGKKSRQFHYAGAILYGRSPETGPALFADDHSFLYFASPLSLNGRLFQRSASGQQKGPRSPDGGLRPFGALRG